MLNCWIIIILYQKKPLMWSRLSTWFNQRNYNSYLTSLNVWGCCVLAPLYINTHWLLLLVSGPLWLMVTRNTVLYTPSSQPWSHCRWGHRSEKYFKIKSECDCSHMKVLSEWLPCSLTLELIVTRNNMLMESDQIIR